MDTQGVRDTVQTTDSWYGNQPHRAARRAAAAAAVRARAPLPFVGMLLLAWGAVAPAHAATTIINTPVTGPITVNTGDRVEIHPGGSVTSATDGVFVQAGGELIISGGSVSGGVDFFDYGVVNLGGTLTISSGSVSGGQDGVGVFGGTMTLSGGSVSGDVTVNPGLATFSGGSISGDVTVENGTLIVSGGSVSGGTSVLNGSATVSGGTFADIGVSSASATMTITGGNFTDDVGVHDGTMTITGGKFTDSVGVQGGTMTISGCHLRLMGTTLQGILQDGTLVSILAFVHPPGQLILDSAAAPIQCPADQTVQATSAAGAVVNYPPPLLADSCGSPVTVTSVPASGSTFPVGSTKVTCTVTNVLGASSSCSFTVTVLAAADLAVSIGASSAKGGGNPLKVNAKQPLTYTIVVTNGGSLSADNVAVQDLLPVNFVLQSATTTQGTLLAPAPGGTGMLTASLGTLAPGGSATVRINGYFTARKTTIPNTASVSTSATDSNLANNQATATVNVN